MNKLKIKKLFTACVMNTITEKDVVLNRLVHPTEEVTVTEETLNSLDSLKEGYQILEGERETVNAGESEED